MSCLFEKRDQDSHDRYWFVAIEKNAVLTELKSFGDPHFDKTRCLAIIKKLLYLLNQGETFEKAEATIALSSVVNLYDFEDVRLRRMFYLIAKELLPLADEVGHVTGCLLKDMNGNIALYRAHSVRLISSMSSGISPTQCLKKAFKDKSPMVQSAAFVCAIKLIWRFPEMAVYLDNLAYHVRSKYVQFHALHLLFLRHDRKVKFLREMFFSYIKSINKYGISKWCFSRTSAYIVARITSQIAKVMPMDFYYYTATFCTYFKSCIHHKDEMLAIQGLRSLNDLTGLTTDELPLAIHVIRPLLRASHKPVVRFGALRALKKVGVTHNVVWATPKDHIAINFDESLKKLYFDEHENKDAEEPVEQSAQVVNFQPLATSRRLA